MRLEFDSVAATLPPVSSESFDDFGFPDENGIDTLLKKGVAAAQGGDRDAARKLLSRASAIDPACEDAWMWLASISEYPEELLAFLDRVLSINSDNSRAIEWRQATRSLLAKNFVQRAVAAREQDNEALAARCVDQAIDFDADFAPAWFVRASMAADDDQKLEFLDRVLELDPEHDSAKNAVAAIHAARSQAAFEEAKHAAMEGDHAKAMDILDAYLEDVPDSVEAWTLKSQVSSSVEQKIDALEKALEIDPENADTKDAIAAIYTARSQAAFEEAKQAAMAGDHAKAIETLDAYLEDVPDSVEAWTLKSHLSSSVEQKIEALEKALEIDPENAAARSGLAFLALTFGASKDATPFESAQAEAPHMVEASEHGAELDRAPYADAAETFTPDASFADQPTEESVEISEPQDHYDFSAQPANKDAYVDDQVEELSAQADEAFEADHPRSVEELFGPVHVSVDAENETVESLSPFESKVSNDVSDHVQAEEISATVDDYEVNDPYSASAYEETVSTQPSGSSCPFCSATNEPQAFDCSSCNARLTLSDIEALLTEREVDRDLVQAAVTQMEAEWNLRDFNENEMATLGLGHLNLGNFDSGLKYLQEASRLDANNVILAGQVNALAIRLDEISRQNELNETRLTGKRILVVDDSPTVRKLISGKLEKSGHLVICASDGVEALEQLENGLPDLVLLDITMPRMDGYEVCKQIRSNPQAKDLPVVMISGKDGFFDKVRGRMAGSTGYVTKPFGPETLMKALETYLLPEA
ncbi:MAG: response regulator [Pyrinomonadaceae bacterium]